MGTLANNEDPNDMQHYVPFAKSRTEIHNNLENSTCYPLKYKIPILIVSICMGTIKALQACSIPPPPPRDIFNEKKIILKQDLFMQSLKKIGKEMPKIESEKPINNINQGP